MSTMFIPVTTIPTTVKTNTKTAKVLREFLSAEHDVVMLPPGTKMTAGSLQSTANRLGLKVKCVTRTGNVYMSKVA